METMTKAKFHLIKRYYTIPIGILGFLCVFGFKYLPPFAGLTPLAMQIFGIFVGAMIFWLFLSITWTSVVIVVALTMSQLFTYQEVLANSIGSWVTSFIIFSSAFCYALGKAGFFKRCAVWILTRRICQKGPWAFLAMMSLCAIAIGSFLATVTAFILLVSITEELFKELGYKKGDRVPQLITMLMLIFTAFSNFITPIAHIMPIMGMSFYTRFTGGLQIGFMQYSMVGIPLCILLSAITIFFMKTFYKADFSKLEKLDTGFLLRDYTPMSKQEKIAVTVFAGVIFFWMVPDIFASIAPAFASYVKSLGTPVPAMVGVVILSLIRVDDKPILELGEALSKGVSWSTFMLVAAADILGVAITHPDVGVTAWLGSMISPVLSGLPPVVCVFVIVLFAEAVTAVSSDLFTITLTMNIALPMVLAGQLPGINPAALTLVISLASVLAIATPGASPSSGIASGAGWIQPKTLFIWGMFASLICLIGLAFIAYPFASLFL